MLKTKAIRKIFTTTLTMFIILTIFTILILGISLLPKNYAVSSSFETDFYRYLRIAIGYILGMLILILANLKKKKVGEKN